MTLRRTKTALSRLADDRTLRRLHPIFVEACLTSRRIILTFGVIAMTSMMIAPARMNTGVATVVSSPRVVAVESGSAPTEIGGTYSKIISAAVDDSGDVAFSATLSDSSANGAILLKSEPALECLCGRATKLQMEAPTKCLVN